MRKLIGLLLIAAIGVGGWYALTQVDTQVERDEQGGVQGITVRPRGGSWAPMDGSEGQGDSGVSMLAPSVQAVSRPTVRIAAYSAGGIEPHEFHRKAISNTLAQITQQFDVIAVQNVGGANPSSLVSWIEAVRQAGGQYDFAVCEEARLRQETPYQAFIFNRATIEIDLDTVRSVEDPADQFQHEPLVGLFRVRGPKPDEAFTFKLISVQIDPAYAMRELSLLPGLYRAARDDGLGEDDIVLLGDFGVSASRLMEALPNATLSLAIPGGPTTARGVALPDNLLFSRRATSEFTGRFGAIDPRSQLGLDAETAHRLAAHLPVWAEFSSIEGGKPGFVAEQRSPQTRR